MKPRPCPECSGAGTGTDPAPWSCWSCGGTGRHVVNEELLVEVFVDVAHLVLNPLTARERARNVVSVLILEDVDPDSPEWEPLIVTMLGRARMPHLGGNTELTDDELREVARRVAAYVRGEELHPEPVPPAGSPTEPDRAAQTQLPSQSQSVIRSAASAPSSDPMTQIPKHAGNGARAVVEGERLMRASSGHSTGSVEVVEQQREVARAR